MSPTGHGTSVCVWSTEKGYLICLENALLGAEHQTFLPSDFEKLKRSLVMLFFSLAEGDEVVADANHTFTLPNDVIHVPLKEFLTHREAKRKSLEAGLSNWRSEDRQNL